MPFNLKRTAILCATMAHIAVIAQQAEAIDKKGTVVTVKNTTVTTANTAPSNPLENDVWQDTSGSANTRPKIWNGTAWISLDYTGTSGSIFYADTDGSTTENNAQLFWDATNNRLGIGTDTPTHKLQVSGQVRASSFANANGTQGSPAYRFNSDGDTGMFRAAANQLGLSTNGTEALRVDAIQNVGIGTNTPNAKLDVDGGTVRLSDYGTGTITGTATNILAVEADGDVIEVDPSSLGNSQKAYGELRLASNHTLAALGSSVIPLDTASPVIKNSTLNTSSYYIQIDIAGVYRVSYSCSMRFSSSINNSMSVHVALNGTNNAIAHTRSSAGDSNLNIDDHTSRSVLLDLNANDRLYLIYTSYSGGNILLWGTETSLNIELVD